MLGLITSGVGMFMNAGASSQASARAKRTAKVNAGFAREESAEEMRRLMGDVRESEGVMNAMSAASGVQTSGSRELSIDKIKKENIAQLDWLKKSGVNKAKAIEMGGQYQASQLKSQADAQMFSGFGKIAQGLYSNYGTGK